MIIVKHQHTVKPALPIFAESGFSAIWIWAVFCVAGTIGAISAGHSIGASCLAGLFGLMPVLVLGLRRSLPVPIHDATRGLSAAAWITLSILTSALSGGLPTLASLIFVTGALQALSDGEDRLALETGLIGVFVFLVCLSAGWAGWLAPAPSALAWLLFPISVVVIAQSAVLSLIIGLNRASRAQASNPNMEAPAAPAAPIEQAPSPFVPDTAPFCLIHISAEGRIRHIEGGQSLRWPSLTAGKVFSEAFPDIPNSSPSTEFETPTGLSTRLYQQPTSNGHIALMVASHDNQVAVAEALRERTAFFAGLGHDLRTPLNAIIGFSDLMKAEIRGPLPDAYKDYAGLIRESGQDLLLLVDDILDLAKADADGHRLEPEPVELGASAASVIRQLEDQAARAEVTLRLDSRAEVWANADARAVRQIWQNLISNAVKYSSSGDTVTLSCKAQDHQVSLCVADEGAGMSEDDLERVATPFAQGANAKGRAGTGLGLAVVKTFADLHEGKVMIDTAPGEGTRITVTLPRANQADLDIFSDAAQ